MEDTPERAAAKAAAVSGAGIKATEDGDTVRFERLGPFGVWKWEKKKSELDETEKAALRNAQPSRQDNSFQTGLIMRLSFDSPVDPGGTRCLRRADGTGCSCPGDRAAGPASHAARNRSTAATGTAGASRRSPGQPATQPQNAPADGCAAAYR